MSNVQSENREHLRGAKWIVALLVLMGCAMPLIFYWCIFGRLPTVTPEQAKTMLRESQGTVLLIDVRRPEVFEARHLDGALNWPLESILTSARTDDIPAQFRSGKLLLLCDVGWDSRRAVEHLSQLGHRGIFQVRGGMQEWIHGFTVERLAFAEEGHEQNASTNFKKLSAVIAPQGELYDRFRIASGRIEELPFRQSPLAEQALAVVAFFFIKPIYELLSLMIIILLWKSREPDLTALRWGMIFFFLGENACAANYFIFRESSYLYEYLHSYGMVLSFGFTAYALLEGIDSRILFLSDMRQRCAAFQLCGNCVKYAEVPCGLKQMFYVLIPALFVVAWMLPTAGWRNTVYNTAVFGRLYNYAHLWIYQVFENWCCAAAACAMLAASLITLLMKKENAIAWAKIAFAAGIGPLGFGMLRLILGAFYDENRVWFLFWEEATEWLFIAGICFVLWIFRRSLLSLAYQRSISTPPKHP
jgi:rhodanese-related sulfurtransferase